MAYKNEKVLYSFRMPKYKILPLFILLFAVAMAIIKLLFVFSHNSKYATRDFIDFIVALLTFLIMIWLSIFIIFIYEYNCLNVILTSERIIVEKRSYFLTCYSRYEVTKVGKSNKQQVTIYFSNKKTAKFKGKDKDLERLLKILDDTLKISQEEKQKVSLIKWPDIKEKKVFRDTFEEKIKNAELKVNNYYLKNSLFDSEYEKMAYDNLQLIINYYDFIIVPHVSLREIFSMIGNTFGELGYLSTHHIDFMIYENKEYKPIVAIEINGYSHETEKQQVSDAFKRGIFQKYGISYINIDNDRIDDISYLRQELSKITYYSLYCRHKGRNKKMIKIDEDTYKCMLCQKEYKYGLLVN